MSLAAPRMPQKAATAAASLEEDRFLDAVDPGRPERSVRCPAPRSRRWSEATDLTLQEQWEIFGRLALALGRRPGPPPVDR